MGQDDTLLEMACSFVWSDRVMAVRLTIALRGWHEERAAGEAWYMGTEKMDAPEVAGNPGRPWPPWAKRLATLAILFHAAAIWAGAWAAPPDSELQRALIA